MSNSQTLKINIAKEKNLKSQLEGDGFKFKDINYAFWSASNSGVTVTFYKSGKLLIQGNNADSVAQKYFPDNNQLNMFTPKQSKSVLKTEFPVYKNWIGTDESGKGDYFGPLVIASVLVEESNINVLSGFNIQDSKKLNDSIIEKVAVQIKANSIFSIVVINPIKYNELYEKFKNLNSLLAWGHARAIENILDKKPCENALSDKFGNESLIKNALMKKGRTINLEQRTKAESDIAVAAASILARNEFVQRMKKMSIEYNLDFPKGASANVIKQASEFVKKNGKESLKSVAKLHFKTTKEILIK